ncbi:general substrate transporter [Dentipellis sp. KUC8613]|nr:general substrate transporter [Dentipellis sp. KUC8613]
MPQRDLYSLSVFGWILCIWVLVVCFQYGYHISTLNQIQAVLTCRTTDNDGGFEYGLPHCIPMSDATFSAVTAVFTVGGLLGSLSSKYVVDRFGRKGAVICNSVLVAMGSGLMGISASVAPLMFGRILTGAGAGIGLCVGPIFLSEIAPAKLKGTIGVLTQFAIVIGILVTQALGMQMASPPYWRLVFMFSFALSALQLVVSPLMVDTPTSLKRKGDPRLRSVIAKLWTIGSPKGWDATPIETEHTLLNGRDRDDVEDFEEPAEERESDIERPPVSILQVFKAPELRRPLSVVCFAMLTQQLSGSTVLYYSNDILSKSLPELGPYVSLGITVVNVVMTFPPIFLIERLGRKTLLYASVAGTLASLYLVGLGLDMGAVALASVVVMTFIASFAIGIGPVPFVIIPEVSPSHAVSSLSLIALSLNWISNFFVGLIFLPLRNILSGGDPSKEGKIFYVFTALLFVSAIGLFRSYKG